ncbi:MAG: S8 family serine peptidase [Patescibacteria group bacterium]|nr:S8 family serine peptidase [Patescibacteria group bacterium]
MQLKKKLIISIKTFFIFGAIIGTVLPFSPAFAKTPVPVAEFIVKFKSAESAPLLAGLDAGYRLRFAGNQAEIFRNIYTFQCACQLSELKGGLAGRFEYLDQISLVKEQAVLVNDPGFTANSSDIDKQWGLLKSGYPETWSTVTGNISNVVAIVDTGVDATHEDLQSVNFVKGFNFISRQEISGKVNSDDNGHGTLVAGILGATPNNNLGIAGTNWRISIMPVKALDESGKGDAATISEAIVWAADNGAQFINLSIGGIGFAHDTVLANSISYAFGKGLVIVAAAGNDAATEGHSLDAEPVFPICDDNNQNMIIGVGAVDQNDVKPVFSNYGKNCLDIVAPGKRILSTINHDPITKKYAPNSYAYASGTSLAVPFVVGQAALLRAMYPSATNVQIRDKIITSADSVDDQNLSQCGGSSCRGLLGAGRINVPKSFMGTFSVDGFKEGDLVKVLNTTLVYQISGGKKRPVSPFVMNRRFPGALVKDVTVQQIETFPEGPYVTPDDGTLIKLSSQPAVYLLDTGQKMPVTYEVFKQRGYNFSAVNTVDFPEFNSWVTTSFLPPADGTIVRGYRGRTVYWTVAGVLHPMNWAFYQERGLSQFSVLRLPDKDIEKMSKGEAFIK